MFKNGITLLVLAATAALVSTDAAHAKSHTIIHHPVVKEIKYAHGKVSLTLKDGHIIRTPENAHAKKVTKVHHKVKQDKKKHKKVHKKVAEDKEEVRTYTYGQVRIAAKNQPAQESHHHKKASKGKAVHKKSVDDGEENEEDWEDENVEDDENKDDDNVEDAVTATQDLELEEGESVSLTFSGHNVSLTLIKNGSLKLEADDGIVTYLPPADDVTIDVDGTVEYDGSDASAGSDEIGDEIGDEESDFEKKKMVAGKRAAEKKEVGVVEKFENEVTEFATKMSGEFFSKKSTPYVIGCGLVGALAVVVGIAAVAVGRARSTSTAAADPQSVLAEDAEEDVEAVTSETATQDAAADESESLSDSDSEVDATEEGTFANQVVVSV